MSSLVVDLYAGKRSPFADSTAAPPPTPASPLTPASHAWSSRTGSLNPSQTSSRATSKAPSRAASLQSELLSWTRPPPKNPFEHGLGFLSQAYIDSNSQFLNVSCRPYAWCCGQHDNWPIQTDWRRNCGVWLSPSQTLLGWHIFRIHYGTGL